MTLLIGINLSECAIIGADTRVNQGPLRWEDGNQKIKIIPTGLMAGAGLAEVHDEVEAALIAGRVASNGEIAAVARTACERRRGRYPRVDGCDLVDITQFMMTMQGADAEAQLFVGWWTPETPDRLHSVTLNRGFPIMPVDTSAGDCADIVTRLNRDLRPMEHGADLEATVRYNVRVMGEIIESVGQRSDYVSESFSVGVHFREARVVRVSEIMQRPDDYLRWSPMRAV